MPEPVVTWVCCPTGIAGGALRLAVVAVPRLTDAGTLTDATALGDWPHQIRDAQWRVAFDPSPETGAVPATAAGTADSNLWRAMFPSDTPVRPFGSEVDRSGLTPVTYPLGEVAETVRGAYAAAAATDPAQDGARAAGALQTEFDLGPLDRFGEAVAREAHPTAVARAFAMQLPRPGSDSGEPDPVDFHQALTLLGDHPALLRGLGLIIDLAVPLASLGAAVPTRLRIDEGSTLPPGVTHAMPWTAVTIDVAASLFAAKDHGAVSGGVFDISTPDFHLETLDVDGAVRRAVALASGPVAADPGPAEPPALLNDGISLVRSGRADELHGRLASSTERRRTAGAGVQGDDLTAADLVRGYRIDVGDDTSADFRSLHARQAHYTIDGFGPYPSDDLPVHDEGLFQESIAGDTELYVHESLVTWRGWSLSTPRPGPVARGRTSPPGAGRWATLHAQVKVAPEPGTLPALRFGRTYRFRLRTVDLAGQSVPVDKAPHVTSTTLTYLRYEPVPPPVVAPVGATDVFDEGETARRLVVRQPLPAGGEDFFLLSAGSPAERLILPPRGTLPLAEEHGMLDDLLHGPNPARRADVTALLARATAALTYPVGEFAPYLPDPQAKGIVFQDLPGVVPGEIVPVLFETDGWDRVRPIRLRLAATPNMGTTSPLPTYEDASRTLTVFLPEGASCTIRISAIPRDPGLMALLRDWSERRTDEEFERINSMASGVHPMFTPSIELELVHAVRQPGYPSFQGEVRPVRARDESPLGLVAAIAVDPQTTDALSLHAQWSDHVDRGLDDLPGTVARADEVFGWRLPHDAASQLPQIEGDGSHRHLVDLNTERLELPRHHLGDTGYREVTYTPVATSRFGDCYPSGSLLRAEGTPAVVRVLNSAVPPPPVVHSVVPSQRIVDWVEESHYPPEDSIVEDLNPAYDLPLTPGWTRTSHARQGSGIRVYLERPWFVTGAEESLGVVLLDPSTPMPSALSADDLWAADTADPRSQWISMAGRDPIRDGWGVTRLGRDDFRGANQERALGALEDAWVDGGKGGWQLPVTILGYIPKFEEASGLWYADIEVNADKSYLPFFRLAVGRFQPNSLTDEVCLSRVSTIDFVQPLPSRLLTILRHGTTDPVITVTLRGSTYIGNSAESHPAEVTAELFFAVPGENDAWRAVESADRFVLERDDTDSYWTATTLLPDPMPDTALRLLVVEHDVMDALGTDDTAKRVIYVGTIDL